MEKLISDLLDKISFHPTTTRFLLNIMKSTVYKHRNVLKEQKIKYFTLYSSYFLFKNRGAGF